MAYFPWKDEYLVQVASIDAQHKRLVDLLNEFYEAMKAGKTKESAADTLNKLIEYTKSHFTFEEKLMKTHGYPGLAEQQKEHAALTAKVLDFQQQMLSGKMVTVQLGSFLKDWLINHIVGIDKKYSKFFTDKGVR
jgi:hemerythrin